MKIFISNSGPIISFARAGHLDLMEMIIGKVWIPRAVYDEIVVKGKGKPGSEEVHQAKWIGVKTIKDRSGANLFPSELGLGEREAIVLAEKLKGALIIDDLRARREAETRKIEVIGSLKIVQGAKDKGLIEKARPITDKLRESGSRIQDEIYYQFLKEMGEE